MSNDKKEFNYLSADRAYNTIYLQYPLVLSRSPYYRDMSHSAKIGYMHLKNRAEYSLVKGLIDEEGKVYFIFTDQEFADVLNVSRPTAIKIKKELADFGLLKKVDMGYDTVKNRRNPSRHYLAELNVGLSDVYKLKNDTKHSKESLLWSEPMKINENIDMVHGKESLHSETTHGKEPLQYIYKQYKDNKDSKDRKPDENETFSKSFDSTNKNTKLQNELMDDDIEFHSLDLIFGDRLITSIKRYSFGSYETFKLYTDKLNYALLSAEKEVGNTINFIENNYMKEMLYRTFKLSIIKEKNGGVNSFSDYLFISFKNCFLDFAKNKNNNDEVIAHNNLLKEQEKSENKK